jgi:hypothetical protein
MKALRNNTQRDLLSYRLWAGGAMPLGDIYTNKQHEIEIKVVEVDG